MSVAKHIEITAESAESFEAAIQTGIDKASETLNEVRSAWVKDQKVLIENGRITTYRVNLKVTFVLD